MHRLKNRKTSCKLHLASHKKHVDTFIQNFASTIKFTTKDFFFNFRSSFNS